MISFQKEKGNNMFATDDDFPGPVIHRFTGITISDYVTKYEELIERKAFHSLPGVCWETVYFDVTIGEDTLSEKREVARISQYSGEESPIHFAIVHQLERVLYAPNQQDQSAQEQLKRVLQNGGRIALLYAHGVDVYGTWWYVENDLLVEPVRHWINEERKQQPDLLLLHVCNERRFIPQTSRIPILYAKGVVGFGRDYQYHVC